MKSYTDLEQSKKLAEILPIESADMEYMFLKKDNSKVSNVPFVKNDDEPEWPDDSSYDFIPCWSLGALISLLPKRYCLETLDNGTYACYNFLSQYEKFGKTPIDAVYSMFVFLKEEKII